MHVVHLPGVDLNLLPLLDALLQERHVTRAARRVGLSQPAASRALGRLRVLLGDPLLVRRGARLTLTPRAEALREPLRLALQLVQQTIDAPAPFDPAQAKRTVSIASDDYGELVVLAPLLSRLARTAPGIDLRVLPPAPSGMDRLARGEVDFYFGPVGERLAPGVRVEVLAEDRFVCIVARDHPFARRAPTLERFLRARHALIAPVGDRGGFVDDALAAQGKERHVALVLPHFLVMPFLIAASDLVLTLAEQVARIYADVLPIALFKPPLAVPGFATGFFWHERDRPDPGLAWVRSEIIAMRASLTLPNPPRRKAGRARPRTPPGRPSSLRGR
jgi:DNA-binding transcriptional LysR family regulator